MCRGFGLAKASPDRVDVKEPRCKAWTCEDCAPWRRRLLIAQIINGEPDKFVTLTWRPDGVHSPNEAFKIMAWAWTVLLKRLRDLHKGNKVEAFWVSERTKQGWPHLHIAMRMPWTDHKLLSKWWKELTGAWVVNIQKVTNWGQVAGYLAKYLSKDPVRFGTSKRYSMTRGYLLAWSKDEPSPRVFGDPWWRKLEVTLLQFKHRLVSQGCWPEIIDDRNTRFWKLGHWPEAARAPPCYGVDCMDTSQHYRASNTHSSAAAAQVAA